MAIKYNKVMDKKDIKFGLLSALFVFASSCSTTTTVLPPPDFAGMMVKASPFKGTKVDLDDSFNSREISVEISAKTDSTVLLKDGTVQMELTLFNKAKNLTLITIKQQTPNIVGFKDAATTNPRDHGFFQPKDPAGNTINELVFNVRVGNKRWTYLLKK